MKARSILNSFILILSATLIFSCEELIEEIFDDPFMTAGTEVLTSQPVVGAENVIFEGEVRNLPSGTQVEYGFMWYNSTEDDPEIYRVRAGRRTSNGSFQSTMMALPRGENLVVCAYVTETRNNYEVIGEERDFSWGF